MWAESFVLTCFDGAWRYHSGKSHKLIQPIMVHIGQMIRQEMLRQERTPAWLARHINCQRPNIYYIFSQSSINTDQLIAISRALNKNFFAYYTDEECGL